MTSQLLLLKNANRRAACPGSHRLESMIPDAQESLYDQIKRVAKDHAFGLITENIFNFSNDVWKEIEDGSHFFQNLVAMDQEHYVMDRGKTHSNLLGFTAKTDTFITIDQVRQLRFYFYDFGFQSCKVDLNWELIGSVILYIEHVIHIKGMRFFPEDFEGFSITLIKPRGSVKIAHQFITPEEYVELKNIYITNEKRALEDNAICKPTSFCKDCKAKYSCEALRTTALQNIDALSSNTNPHLTNIELSNELRLLRQHQKMLGFRIVSLETEAIERLKNNELIPGFTLTSQKKMEVWKISEDQVIQLGLKNGFDLSNSKKSVITPKQAIKLGMDEEIVRKNSHTPAGEKQLTAVE